MNPVVAYFLGFLTPIGIISLITIIVSAMEVYDVRRNREDVW